jgi:hypothetical protein
MTEAQAAQARALAAEHEAERAFRADSSHANRVAVTQARDAARTAGERVHKAARMLAAAEAALAPAPPRGEPD